MGIKCDSCGKHCSQVFEDKTGIYCGDCFWDKLEIKMDKELRQKSPKYCPWCGKPLE